MPKSLKNSKFGLVMFFRKHLGFIFGFGVAVVALAMLYLSSRPLIPLVVQEQIEADIEKCGGQLKETRCAVSGEGDWIFLQESLVNLVVDWKENLNSFVAFNDSLEARGIKLVVVPVPDK